MKQESRARLSEEQKSALRRRRQTFLSEIGGGIAVLASAKPNSGPSGYRSVFRQDSDFLYLTGCAETHALAVFVPQHPEFQSVLFLRERDALLELWNGPMWGVSGTAEALGFDRVFPLSEFESKIPEWLAHADTIYWDSSPDLEFYEQLRPLLQGSRLRRNGAEILNVRDVIHEMRLFKTDDERDTLRHANAIASRAHEAAMQFASVGATEFQVQSVLEAVMKSAGSTQLGYPSIVASGTNACCLHYNVNSCSLEQGDLLLIDAGCEWNFYTADITRTFPVSGKFSAEQRILYELVLDTQLKAIASVRPGVKWSELNESAGRSLTIGLKDCGILRCSVEEALEKKKYKDFFPHGLGHWLGLDVHDVGRYKIKSSERLFEAGMCLTIEPGVYIQPGTSDVDARWHGIGIRIEDNILVTKEGHENLTPCVKNADAIEAMVGAMPEHLKRFFL
jgi:Xaa-Pro aminopeptidase